MTKKVRPPKRYHRTISVPLRQESFDYLYSIAKEQDLSIAALVRRSIEHFCKLNENLIQE